MLTRPNLARLVLRVGALVVAVMRLYALWVQVLSMDGRYAGFAEAKTGHGLVALFGCFVFVFLVGTALAAFSWRILTEIQ